MDRKALSDNYFNTKMCSASSVHAFEVIKNPAYHKSRHKSSIISSSSKGSSYISLYQVKQQQLSQIPYNCIGKIITSTSPNEFYSGLGCLISPEIVITSAHLFVQASYQLRIIQKYKPQFFILNPSSPSPTQIDIIDIIYPPEFYSYLKRLIKCKKESKQWYKLYEQSVQYDYAVVKIKKNPKIDQMNLFPKIMPNFSNNNQDEIMVAAIVSNVDNENQNRPNNQNISEQMGFKKGKLNINNEEAKILASYPTIKTKQGFSGTPVLLCNIQKQQFFIIGIHKGQIYHKSICTYIITETNDRINHYIKALNQNIAQSWLLDEINQQEMIQEKGSELRMQAQFLNNTSEPDFMSSISARKGQIKILNEQIFQQKKHTSSSYIVFAAYLLFLCSYKQQQKQKAKLQKSEQILLKVQKQDPKNWQISFLLGIAYYQQKKYAKANQYFRKSIHYNQQNFLAQLYLYSCSQYQIKQDLLQKQLFSDKQKINSLNQKYGQTMLASSDPNFLSKQLLYISSLPDQLGSSILNKWFELFSERLLKIDSEDKYKVITYLYQGFCDAYKSYQKRKKKKKKKTDDKGSEIKVMLKSKYFQKISNVEQTDTLTSIFMCYIYKNHRKYKEALQLSQNILNSINLPEFFSQYCNDIIDNDDWENEYCDERKKILQIQCKKFTDRQYDRNIYTIIPQVMDCDNYDQKLQIGDQLIQHYKTILEQDQPNIISKKINFISSIQYKLLQIITIKQDYSNIQHFISFFTDIVKKNDNNEQALITLRVLKSMCQINQLFQQQLISQTKKYYQISQIFYKQNLSELKLYFQRKFLSCLSQNEKIDFQSLIGKISYQERSIDQITNQVDTLRQFKLLIFEGFIKQPRQYHKIKELQDLLIKRYSSSQYVIQIILILKLFILLYNDYNEYKSSTKNILNFSNMIANKKKTRLDRPRYIYWKLKVIQIYLCCQLALEEYQLNICDETDYEGLIRDQTLEYEVLHNLINMIFFNSYKLYNIYNKKVEKIKSDSDDDQNKNKQAKLHQISQKKIIFFTYNFQMCFSQKGMCFSRNSGFEQLLYYQYQFHYLKKEFVLDYTRFIQTLIEKQINISRNDDESDAIIKTIIKMIKQEQITYEKIVIICDIYVRATQKNKECIKSLLRFSYQLYRLQQWQKKYQLTIYLSLKAVEFYVRESFLEQNQQITLSTEINQENIMNFVYFQQLIKNILNLQQIYTLTLRKVYNHESLAQKQSIINKKNQFFKKIIRQDTYLQLQTHLFSQRNILLLPILVKCLKRYFKDNKVVFKIKKIKIFQILKQVINRIQFMKFLSKMFFRNQLIYDFVRKI